MKPNIPQEEFNESDHFISGLFYFNKNDHILFPDKRFKYLGWTIYFANSYPIFSYLISIVTVLSLL